MQAFIFILLLLFQISWWLEPTSFISNSPLWILQKWRFYRLLLTEENYFKFGCKGMRNDAWRWLLGLIYIIAVAAIWIAASFVVQSVVDEGVSPFLITYICNSLFIVYVPLVEIARYLEDECGTLLFWKKWKLDKGLQASEEVILLGDSDENFNTDEIVEQEDNVNESTGLATNILSPTHVCVNEYGEGLDAKGRWTRTRVAKVSLLICPFWFLAQLTFNFSLKYTTVTSNTILSSASSLFTFLVSLAYLGEKFTWVKLVSVLLCMGGTIIVSLGDSETGLRVSAANPVLGDSETGFRGSASNPVLGDVFAIVSSAFYAVYITLIRKNLPDDDDESGKMGKASMAQFLGFLGLFNLVIFLPFVLVLNFTKLEPFDVLTAEQFGLIVGKGLLDNVLSDYLWAKAVLLTTTTVATAGLTIQVPLAAIVDSIIGNAPHLLDYIGAAAIMLGFAGINIPSNALATSKTEEVEEEEEANLELENGNLTSQSK